MLDVMGRRMSAPWILQIGAVLGIAVAILTIVKLCYEIRSSKLKLEQERRSQNKIEAKRVDDCPSPEVENAEHSEIPPKYEKLGKWSRVDTVLLLVPIASLCIHISIKPVDAAALLLTVFVSLYASYFLAARFFLIGSVQQLRYGRDAGVWWERQHEVNMRLAEGLQKQTDAAREHVQVTKTLVNQHKTSGDARLRED